LPNGVAQTVPESDLLSTVNRFLWHAYLSNVCRSPHRVPDFQCGLFFRDAWLVKAAQVVSGVEWARSSWP
jgi:hypothetical protein